MAARKSSRLVPLRDLVELAEAVLDMRRRQKEYFDDRLKRVHLLDAARGAERRIDQSCRDIVTSQYRTESLFTPGDVSPPEALLAACERAAEAMATAAERGVHSVSLIDFAIDLRHAAKVYKEWR